jgi:hypothetical protein
VGAVVLPAATLHAGWNVVVRAGSGRHRKTTLLLGGGAVTAAVVQRLALCEVEDA